MSFRNHSELSNIDGRTASQARFYKKARVQSQDQSGEITLDAAGGATTGMDQIMEATESARRHNNFMHELQTSDAKM